MRTGTKTYEIRAALCSIDDEAAFLVRLREVSRRFDTHIICFNADMLAGRKHVESAMQHAIRSFGAGDAISNTLEMEALLYAAGSRQCNVATLFGLHEGKNRLWVCCYPKREGVWKILMPVLQFQDGDNWEIIDHKKREHLMQIFEITREEVDCLEDGSRFIDLVLERVALLDVLR